MNVIQRTFDVLTQMPPLQQITYELSLRELDHHLQTDQNLGQVLETVAPSLWECENIDRYEGYGVYRDMHAMQDYGEFKELLQISDSQNPDRIIEIGTGYGGSLYALAQLVSPECIVSIDKDQQGYFDRRHGFPNAKVPLFDRIGEYNDTEMVHIRADSQKSSTRKIVQRNLPCGMADFLLIDADHTYEGVKRDWELYSSIVDDGGMIVIHDINTGDFREEWGVEEFWKERIKPTHTTEEIVLRDTGFGTGIVYL